MKYDNIKNKKDTTFKRKVGIPRILFEMLVGVLEIPFKEKQSKGGPKPKLSIEDILLMTLIYIDGLSGQKKLSIKN